MNIKTLELAYTALRQMDKKIKDAQNIMSVLDGDTRHSETLNSYRDAIEVAFKEINKVCTEVGTYRSPNVSILVTKDLDIVDMMKESK